MQLNLLQAQRQDELAAIVNDRQTIRDFNRNRGEIISADGVVLAYSEPLDDPEAELKYRRV